MSGKAAGGRIHLTIEFPSGESVLDAYWGSLASGGLTLAGLGELELGQPVDLTVRVAGQRLELSGRIAERCAHRPGGYTHVAFAPGAPHEALLSLAWALIGQQPPRRHRRRPTHAHVAVSVGEVAPFGGRLLNLSAGGCCVFVPHDGELIRKGDPVTLVVAGAPARGRVKWRSGADLGLEFDSDGEATRLASALELDPVAV